jgi:hypothetical protein
MIDELTRRPVDCHEGQQKGRSTMEPQSDNEVHERSPGVFSRIEDRLAKADADPRPSKPLLGVLPLRRLIPQDLHSVLDYGTALVFLGSAFVFRSRKARAVGAGLGSTVGGYSLLTDYRMSLFKLIPIEAHEGLDYAVALASLAAPFALGYAKKDRAATWFAVGSGLGALVVSMLTDYRAAKGSRRAAPT